MDGRAYDVVAEAVVIIDLDGNVLLWNGAAERLLGWPAVDVIGRALDVTQTLGETRSTPACQLRHRDGATLGVSVAQAPSFGDRGALQGTIYAISARSVLLAPVTALRVDDDELRQMIQTSLIEHDVRLRLALNTTFVRVFTQDTDLRYTSAFGIGVDIRGTLLGRRDEELVPPDEAAQLTALKRRVLETGVRARQVLSLTLRGEVRDLDLTIDVARDHAGVIVGITGAAWDVTEQRRLITRQEEVARRAVIEAAPEPYFVADARGRYVDVNAAACALLGYTRAELLTMGLVDLISEPLGLDPIPLDRDLTEERRLQRKTGEFVDVELATRILADGRRQGVMRDITPRKEVERARARAQELERQHLARLQELDEATRVISSIDALTDGVGRVLQRVIDQARRLVNADYGVIGGLDHAPQQSGHPVAAADAVLEVPMLRDGHPIGQLHLAKRPDPDGFTAADHGIVTLLAGHAAIAIENARLLDERQVAVRTREDVIAIVSHDLRSPLNAIELRASLLARTQTDPRVLEHARNVRRSVSMMQRMIGAMLDGARLELGMLQLTLGTHDLGEMIAEVVEVFAPIATDRDVRIELRSSTLPPQRFDRDRLLHVVFNLVGNAVKFSHVGGIVVLAVELRDGELEVTVTDEGVGIAPEALPRVFDRYFTTARGNQGTGLGLFIARGVVEAHGGRIWVESTPGQGSTFHFTLPRADAAIAP
ncbi:MAG: ATP-binding protein [Proteobacteria bacterium]|nr:ATP-binding protein [Pseudomonadota bacterium]